MRSLTPDGATQQPPSERERQPDEAFARQKGGRAGGEHLRGSARAASTRLGVRACAHVEADDVDAVSTALVEQVCALHDALGARPHLEPEPATNDLFCHLVSLAVDPDAVRHSEAVLTHSAVAPLLGSLRRLCAEGEYELERWWARRIVEHPDPRTELSRFPYFQNYRDLARLEHHAITGASSQPIRRVLFVGSGPLPLTSLLLDEQYGCEVDNLDREPDAVAAGAALAAALDRPRLRFRVGELGGYDLEGYDLEGYDLVYLAALAGLDVGAKQRLLEHLGRRLSPGTLVLARSAHSLRGLLYPVLDPRDLSGLETLAVTHPFTDVVNSVVVARVPRATDTPRPGSAAEP